MEISVHFPIKIRHLAYSLPLSESVQESAIRIYRLELFIYYINRLPIYKRL